MCFLLTLFKIADTITRHLIILLRSYRESGETNDITEYVNHCGHRDFLPHREYVAAAMGSVFDPFFPPYNWLHLSAEITSICANNFLNGNIHTVHLRAPTLHFSGSGHHLGKITHLPLCGEYIPQTEPLQLYLSGTLSPLEAVLPSNLHH